MQVTYRLVNTPRDIVIVPLGEILLHAADDNLQHEAARLHNGSDSLVLTQTSALKM